MIYKFNKKEITEALTAYLVNKGMVPEELCKSQVNVRYKVTSAPNNEFTHEIEITKC